MTSIPASVRAEPTRLSYARKRLLLGITGVGTAVLFAISALLFGLPSRVLSTSTTQPARAAIASIALTFAAEMVARCERSTVRVHRERDCVAQRRATCRRRCRDGLQRCLN